MDKVSDTRTGKIFGFKGGCASPPFNIMMPQASISFTAFVPLER
jgi:hypothetical protein